MKVKIPDSMPAALLLVGAGMAFAAHASGPLNDTGSTRCTTATIGTDASDCFSDPSAIAGQDGKIGRDPARAHNALVKAGASANDGVKGFDFTKLDTSGNPLPASASTWDCVRDNVTGLIWEVKVNDTSSPRHQTHAFRWHNPDSTTNGGTAGPVGNTTTCGATLAPDNCNTLNYIAYINTAGICGFSSGWRMPSIMELVNLADYGRNPAVDPDFIVTSGTYASGTPFANSAGNILTLQSNGFSGSSPVASNTYLLRLVHD